MSDRELFLIGAVLCAIVGFVTGYIWRLMVESRKSWKRTFGEKL